LPYALPSRIPPSRDLCCPFRQVTPAHPPPLLLARPGYCQGPRWGYCQGPRWVHRRVEGPGETGPVSITDGNSIPKIRSSVLLPAESAPPLRTRFARRGGSADVLGSVPLGVGYRGAGMRPGGRCRCCCCGGCVDRGGWWEGEGCGGGGAGGGYGAWGLGGWGGGVGRGLGCCRRGRGSGAGCAGMPALGVSVAHPAMPWSPKGHTHSSARQSPRGMLVVLGVKPALVR